MEEQNNSPDLGRGGGRADAVPNLEETAPYRLVQMLINEIINDPNPTELINRNIARLSAQVSSMDNNANGQGQTSHRRLSNTPSSATSNTQGQGRSVNQGSNTDIRMLATARRLRLLSEMGRRCRQFTPSEDDTAGSTTTTTESEGEGHQNGINRGSRRRHRRRRRGPGPRTSSRSPPTATTTTMTNVNVNATGRRALWRQLQLHPLPPAPAMLPSSGPGGGLATQSGPQSWRTLRQLGHHVRRFNLEHRLSQRFPSALDNDSGLLTSFPPIRSSPQNLFPDKPERIQIGTRSFQPTAKFDNVPQAKPAKPGTLGFARCQEKALAAKFVQTVVGARPSFSSETDQLWNPGMDIFNRFWNETDTISDDDIENGRNPPHSRTYHTLITSITVDNVTYPEPDTAAAYLLWDAETSVANHSRVLWDTLSAPARRRQGQGSTSSIGVGTQDGRTSRRGTYDPGNNSSSSNNEDDLPALESVPPDELTSSRNQDLGFRFNRFMGQTLSEEAVAAMFRMEMPPIPTIGSLGGENMDPNQFPISLRPQFDVRPSREYPTALTLEDSGSGSEDEDGDEGYSSVFSRIPDADPTPSPLFRGLVHDLEQRGQSQGTSSAGIYFDDIIILGSGDDGPSRRETHGQQNPGDTDPPE